jgi:hypothetical protein
MERPFTQSVTRFDVRLALWAALAFALVLLAWPSAPLALPAAEEGYDAPFLSELADDGSPESAPAPSGDEEQEPEPERLELPEEDLVLDDRACVLVVVELKRPGALIVEPDSRHTQRLERPPIHAA